MTLSFQVYWISADGQSSMDMGEFCTEEEARYMCAQALDDLIAVGSADDEAALRAGTWRVERRGMRLNLWTRPEHYAGAAWVDYYVFLSRTRDSRLLEISNFECALAELGGESETVVVVRDGHWAVGWIEWIAIHKSDADSLAIAESLAAALADYPVLNEDDYFFQQFEQACDTWESMSVRERALLLREAGECIFSARRDKLPNSSRIYEQLTQGL